MEPKSVKINIPEGYEIDEENSTFSEIKFKLKEVKYPKSWQDAFGNKQVKGYYISNNSSIRPIDITGSTFTTNTFKTKKQAESALAYAQITQLMALPCYNGDWVPDWTDSLELKYGIRVSNVQRGLEKCVDCSEYCPIVFKDWRIRDAFLKNHKDLLMQYFELS